MFSNVIRGIAIGLFFTVAYSLYSILLYFLRGSEPFADHNTTLASVLAAYFFGGIVGGGTVGLLHPFVRSRTSAMLVGIVAAFFVSLGLMVAIRGTPTHWEGAEWATVAIMALIFGIFGGTQLWQPKVK